MIDAALLNCLADGQFHSGQEVGKSLGISRSAVWKQVKYLETLGVEVYSVRGRGYRIPGGLELLNEAAVQECFSGRLSQVVSKQVVDSTNLMALRELNQPGAHRSLYLAEYQESGKGRRGRRWVSPFASNLYMSLIWRFQQGVAALEGLSLVVGVAVAEALQAYGLSDVQLKWPNDLLVGQSKLGGILLEMQGDASGECHVVIGIGLNVAMHESAATEVDQPWTSVAGALKRPVSRNELLMLILERLIDRLETFSQQGFSAFKPQWEALHAYQNEDITLHLGSKQISGRCIGVDEHGALLVDQDGEVKTYHAGEVSVRLHGTGH